MGQDHSHEDHSHDDHSHDDHSHGSKWKHDGVRVIPAGSLDDGIRIAADLAGAGSRISFFPCPQRCLPVLSGKDA